MSCNYENQNKFDYGFDVYKFADGQKSLYNSLRDILGLDCRIHQEQGEVITSVWTKKEIKKHVENIKNKK